MTMYNANVESSQLLCVSYDSDKRELFITFKNNSVYKYSNVSLNIYSELIDSGSVGKYFSENVKGKYNSIKL